MDESYLFVAKLIMSSVLSSMHTFFHFLCDFNEFFLHSRDHDFGIYGTELIKCRFGVL